MFEEDESTVMIPTFSPGSFFADRYRIVRLLGSGAMGRVYEAVEVHRGDRRVALKVLHGERVAEAETVARFKREAEVLASIGHPCIVEVYTFHKSQEAIPYLAMELLEGVTLKTRLQNAGRFEDPSELQEIVDGLSSALELAHEHGVIHRDLKPDNIFLPATGDPRAKLVDFGLSRMAKQDKSITASGMIIGTPRYMAPEQIRNASSTGPVSDIYSLGVVIYECLTGQSPYPAHDYGQLLGCLMEGRTTPFLEHRPDLPEFTIFMPKALAPDPKNRYQTGGELADAYAEAVGKPSLRHEIRARTKSQRPPRNRERSKSYAGMVPSKASTLAFDASAARAALADLEAGPPPGMNVDPEALEAFAEARTISPSQRPPPMAPPMRPPPQSAPPPRSAPPPPKAPIPQTWPATPAESLYSDNSVTDPMRPNEISALSNVGAGRTAPFPAAMANPAASSSSPAIPNTPAPVTPAPVTPAPVTPAPTSSPSHPAVPAQHVPPPQVQAQGGDTLYLGEGAAVPMYPPAPSGPPPPMESMPQVQVPHHGPAFAGGLPAAPPKQRRSYGLVIFLFALLLVVILSALGGFALRAHMRGELEIPGISD